MEEKRNYIIYDIVNGPIIRVIRMTREQANTIRDFLKSIDYDDEIGIELAENFEGDEI
jgi:hypothetical protein